MGMWRTTRLKRSIRIKIRETLGWISFSIAAILAVIISIPVLLTLIFFWIAAELFDERHYL